MEFFVDPLFILPAEGPTCEMATEGVTVAIVCVLLALTGSVPLLFPELKVMLLKAVLPILIVLPATAL